MSKQILEQIQEVATQRKQEMERLTGDPREQLRLYNKIVAQVTRYQRKMCEVFGTPTPVLKKGFQLGPGDYLRWQDGLVSAEELRRMDVEFKGACILQSQEVKSLETEAIVIYHAQLNVDEHYFLEQALPSTKTLLMHDPIYTIYDFEIHIPRGELVKESLHAISRAMRRHKKDKSFEQPQVAARRLISELREWHAPTTPTTTVDFRTVTPNNFNFVDNSTAPPLGTIMSSLNAVLPTMSSFAASSSASSITARTLY